MRYSHVPSADTSAILANLSRQMLSILVSLTLMFAAIPATAQETNARAEGATGVGPGHHNGGIAGQGEVSESLHKTLDLLQAPGFSQELSDLLSPELSLERVASGDLETPLTESVLQEPEEDKGMSTGAKVAIIAGVTVAILAIAVVAIVNTNETGSPF
jgi:hypothetical protein